MRLVSACIIALLCVPLSGCSDEESPAAPEPVVYEGITRTSAIGDVIEDDPDDWRDTSELGVSPAWPNPVYGPSVSLRYFTQQAADVRVVLRTPERVVRVLYEGSSTSVKTLYWDRKDDSGADAAEGIYRAVIEATIDGTKHSSYGDIQLDPIPSP